MIKLKLYGSWVTQLCSRLVANAEVCRDLTLTLVMASVLDGTVNRVCDGGS